jgi:phosphoribosylformimino-5-aminoimidazole carboxamide ribotide isomerase
MIVIPAIDLLDGKCVRLTEGDYSRSKVYEEDPLKVALRFEEAGFTHLHLVDLEGARSGKPVHLSVLRAISGATRLQIDFSGGLREQNHLEEAFENGAARLSIGSTAARRPELFLSWLDAFGPERLILGADSRNGMIAVQGWQEKTEWEVDEFIGFYFEKGIRRVICTDISRDGRMEGPSLSLYERLLEKWPALELIASGGVSDENDLVQLREAGLFACVVGKAIYEGRIRIGKDKNHYW